MIALPNGSMNRKPKMARVSESGCRIPLKPTPHERTTRPSTKCEIAKTRRMVKRSLQKPRFEWNIESKIG